MTTIEEVEQEEVEQAAEPVTGRIMQFLLGKEISGAVVAAAELRIADAVGEEPTPVTELARIVGADPDALYRLMRALTTLGIFQEVDERTFAHSELSAGLRSEAPEKLADMVLLEGAEWGWRMSSGMAEAIRSGQPLFPAIYGKDLFSYFMEDEPEAGQVFDRAMTAITEASLGPITEALDLTGVTTVVDVGGGQGSLLRTVLERNPDAQGVLLEVEPVIGEAHEDLRSGTLSARCQLVPGDCRESIPVAADMYLFRHVLHMWDDETGVQILRNCAASARPNSRIVVIEQLLSDGPDGQYAALMDLHMLAVGGGRFRSVQDFARLLQQAGLRLQNVTTISSGDSLVEATPVGN